MLRLHGRESAIIEVKAHEKDLLELVKMRVEREDNLRQIIELELELGIRIKDKGLRGLG